MQSRPIEENGPSDSHASGSGRRAIDPLLELPGVRPSVRWLRRLPERLLHPLRRRRALRRLREQGLPRTVLFVCIGNIYRSPYAASRFQTVLPQPLRATTAVRSAGFVGPDRPSPPEAVALASSLGIDLTPHRSALLSQETIAESELIVVMDETQRDTLRGRFPVPSRTDILVLGDLDPEPILRRGIVDPWNQQGSVLADCYARVDRCVDALVRAITPSKSHL